MVYFFSHEDYVRSICRHRLETNLVNQRTLCLGVFCWACCWTLCGPWRYTGTQVCSFQGGSAKAMARDKKLVEDTTASASDSERRVTRWSNEDKQAQMIGKETKKNLIKNASPVKTRQKANCTKNVFLKPIIAKKEQQAPYMYAALKHKKHKSHKSLHEAPCTSLPQNQKSFFPIWFT